MTQAGQKQPRLRHQVEENVREIDPALLAERRAREIAAERLSITGRLLGDPPPGFSARDRPPAQPVAPTLAVLPSASGHDRAPWRMARIGERTLNNWRTYHERKRKPKGK